MVGHVGEHLPWGWLAFAALAVALARYASRRVEEAEAGRVQPVRRRPPRQRKALARAKRSRATRAAQERRRMARRLRRRRRFQARARARTWPSLPIPGLAPLRLPDPAPLPTPDAAAEEADIEIDLRDSVLYDSVITLESGDRLESGIVGWAPRR